MDDSNRLLIIKKRSMVLVLFHIYMQWSKSAAITRHWPDCHKLPSNQVLPCMVQCLEIIFSFFFYQHRMRNKTKTRGTWYTGRKVLSSTDSSEYVSSHIHVLQLFISKRTLLMVWEQLYNGVFFSESIKQTWTMTVREVTARHYYTKHTEYETSL